MHESKGRDYKLKVKKGYKQEGPTCGIYAILNGVFEYKKCNKGNIKKIAEKIWETATKDSNKIDEKINSTFFKYSLVGEFFDSKALQSFIKEHSGIIPGYFLDVDLSNKTLDSSNLEKNEFYLVPINANHKKSKNNMHWVCLKKDKNSIKLVNSTGNKAIRLAKKNAGLRHNFARCSMNDMNKLIECMENRDGKNLFDFHEWACRNKRKKWSKYPFILNTFNRLKEKPCEYYFCKSEFYPIKIKWYVSSQ